MGFLHKLLHGTSGNTCTTVKSTPDHVLSTPSPSDRRSSFTTLENTNSITEFPHSAIISDIPSSNFPSYSTCPSSQSSQRTSVAQRPSFDRAVLPSPELSDPQGLPVLTTSNWRHPLRPSVSTCNLRSEDGKQDAAGSDRSSTVNTSGLHSVIRPRRSSNATLIGEVDQVSAVNKRMSRLRSKIINPTRPTTPVKSAIAARQREEGVEGRQLVKVKCAALATDRLLVADADGRAEFVRIIELLCPFPVGFTPDAFEERVDLIKGVVNTALAKKDVRLTAATIFQILEVRTDRRLKSLVESGKTDARAIHTLHLPLAFALARQLCGSSPFVSHLRLFIASQDEETSAVFYPGMGAISSVRDIIEAGGSTRSPPHSARLTEPVHLLYPNTNASQQRGRLSLSIQSAAELPRNPLATGGRPPPLRPCRRNRNERSPAVRGMEQAGALRRETGVVTQDKLPRPLRSHLRLRLSPRPRTSPATSPNSPHALGPMVGEGQRSGVGKDQSLWDSTQASDGHECQSVLLGETIVMMGSPLSVVSRGFATADTSPPDMRMKVMGTDSHDP